MKIFNAKLGRFANAVFRYSASVIFSIIYNATITYNQDECTETIDDNIFINYTQMILDDKVPHIDPRRAYYFSGFYQHDKIFIKYKNQIINHIKNNPFDKIFTDGNHDNMNQYNYNQRIYNAIDILPKYIDKKYEVVIHLRLEDFLNHNIIHPLAIINILDTLKKSKYCFVINKPTQNIEFAYIDYFKKYGEINNCEIIIECENDVLYDYQIMLHSTILICSYSTLSWIAALFSETVTLVYMPNYPQTHDHCTFKKPIENTILYDYIYCKRDELEMFLSGKITSYYKQDPYCAIDCKKQPITNRILEYLKDIKNGFYIEAGAYDGILQSNTKFLEEELGWSGLLVEPSPQIFKLLVTNRGDNININKCLVSSTYKDKKINGAFDNGPMSSVNNIRNIENAELIEVECDTLENILNNIHISKIDYMILDTEGYEYDVLEGMNLIKYRPTYLLIEIYTSEKEKIFNYLEKNNYLFLENITNYNIYDNPGWDGTHNDYLFKAL